MKVQGGGPPPIRSKATKQALASRGGHRAEFYSEASKELNIKAPLLASILGVSALRVRLFNLGPLRKTALQLLSTRPKMHPCYDVRVRYNGSLSRAFHFDNPFLPAFRQGLLSFSGSMFEAKLAKEFYIVLRRKGVLSCLKVFASLAFFSDQLKQTLFQLLVAEGR